MNMGRYRQITVDGVVDMLRTGDKPVYTMNDIAEEFDVAKETVRRRMPDVTEEPGVRQDKIGQTNVYWFEGDEETESPASGDRPDRLDIESADNIERGGEEHPEEEPDSSTASVFGELATWRVVLMGVGVIILGYINLGVAHVAATAGADTVALGLLALTLVFVLTGLGVMLVSLIALIVTVPGSRGRGVTDGGVTDV